MTRPSCPKGQSPGREGSVAGGGVEGVCGVPTVVPQAGLTPQLLSWQGLCTQHLASLLGSGCI